MAINQNPNEPPPPPPDPDPDPTPTPPPLEPFQMSKAVTVTVRPPFTPGPVERAFDVTTYLDELLSLANRYARATGATSGPTKQQLAARLFQPLDRLTLPEFYEQATAPVAQVRIAVEVLRGVLGATPLPSEQRFRAMAYDALLRELGTTYHELRQARLEPLAVRVELANRLGVELSGTRPDRLDEITVSPEEITDAQLADLFGYRSTAPSDPLQPSSSVPVMLVALQAGLKTVWRRQDDADRNVPGQELPVIDADIVAFRNIRTGAGAAEMLWSTREGLSADWHNEFLDAIGTTQAQFDAAIHEVAGAIDIPGLAAADAAGDDITATLLPTGLSLQAFRHLVRLRTVFPDGVLLASERSEVASILVQARKVLRFAQWRQEEREQGVVLQPATFLPDPIGTIVAPPSWRGEQSTVDDWHATLRNRIQEAEALDAQYRSIVESAEALVLPQLRDALLAEIGKPQSHTADQVADRLSRELCLDLRAAGDLRTDRAGHAVATTQSLLVSIRSGVFGQLPDPVKRLTIPAQEDTFDLEWEWLVSYPRWVSAMRAFAYPENQLHAGLYRTGENSPPQGVPASQLLPTQEYQQLTQDLAQRKRISPSEARTLANDYLHHLRQRLGTTVVPANLILIDSHTASSLTAHAGRQDTLIPHTVTTEEQVPQTVREMYWLVPMALARKLQDSREFSAALDWYQTVFNYQVEPAKRKIYRGLTKEMSIPANYDRIPGWSALTNLNPHFIARKRPGAYTRFTIVSIVECVLAFADSEFARDTQDANARARTLYQTAIDLLGLPEMTPPAPEPPFPANPVVGAIRSAAEAGLAKIHAGLNISGFSAPAVTGSGKDSFLPSQYRYAVLIERAKALVSTAQQIESAYLSALERADTENYNLLQAGHDLRVAAATLDMQDVKVAGADLGFTLASLQRRKSRELFSEMGRRLSAGLNAFERWQLDSMRAQKQLTREARIFGMFGRTFSAVAGIAAGGAPNMYELVAQHKSGQAELAALDARFAEVQAGFTRRQEDWALQRSQAARDVEIGTQQILLALNQRELALRERGIAELNRQHAESVAEFLATKFTNAELHEWMSGVLGRVYAHFLQQATGMARLAQAQLAFERQEPAVGFIAADYWQDGAADTDPDGPPTDRRGLTGSARLLRDIDRLDQHAFQSDQRKLQLSQTIAVSQLAGFELQQLRQTGVLTFATPEELFDRDFPGHYLRLVKKITVDIIALVPPTRRIRATLSTSGISRTVVARGPFQTVTLRRDPESIAFTSPVGATGVFQLQADNGMLLPFEGMGVDGVWRLDLPKAANPFDFNNIADVLFTVEYTALHSDEHRRQVIRRLGRRQAFDQTFSVRDQFPDAWYALNNPDTVADPAMRMRVSLPLTRADFPAHIGDLAVRELAMFVMWRDPDGDDELTVTALSHDKDTAGSVTTTGGIISTRRTNGAPWRALTGVSHDPVGDWQIKLPDTSIVRSWFADELIEDVVLVMSLSGTTPEWP